MIHWRINDGFTYKLLFGIYPVTARKVLRMGHPLLLETSHPVSEFNTTDLRALVQDLQDTMRAEDGAGIAAPQIGVLLRVVVFELDDNPRYPNEEKVPNTVMLNPTITPLSDEMSLGWEGCLSVPGLRGQVPRYEHIRYSAYTLEGECFEREVSGFHARVVQHECDHLDGILYPQRIDDMRQFGFIEELADKLGC